MNHINQINQSSDNDGEGGMASFFCPFAFNPIIKRRKPKIRHQRVGII
jgi:hypothetical protein